MVTPVSDAARLGVLRRAVLLDTPAERAFDRITELASKLLNVPVALVSLVDEDRQFFKSCVGLSEPWANDRQTPLSHSFCQHAVESRRPLIISDARAHPLVAENLAIRDLGVIAYAGIPLIVEGEALGSFCVIDNRPRVWTEEEIATLTTLAESVMSEIELRVMTAAARKAVKERDDMIAMISHDLRNPASLIVSSAELLYESWLTDEQRTHQIDVVKRAGMRMLRLIDDLLTSSHVDNGAFAGARSAVDLTEVVRTALSDVRHTKTTRIAMREFLADVPLVLNADADLLRRVLDNLLDNAIKFTPAGGSITVTTAADDDVAVLRVADTGKGISPENLERLFERFVQLQPGRHGGAGLGLTIARGIVEAFGGTLRVTESTPGQGTTFEARLPLAVR